MENFQHINYFCLRQLLEPMQPSVTCLKNLLASKSMTHKSGKFMGSNDVLNQSKMARKKTNKQNKTGEHEVCFRGISVLAR